MKAAKKKELHFVLKHQNGLSSEQIDNPTGGHNSGFAYEEERAVGFKKKLFEMRQTLVDV